jgi:DNA-binding MarR family transcriptional regulator
MSTKESIDRMSGKTNDSMARALAMPMPLITFIANRTAVGAAGMVREMGITVTEGRVLWLISTGLAATAAEAVRAIGIDKAAVSRAVNGMIERGLLRSVPDARHQGRNLLTMTDAGKTHARALERLMDARERGLLAGVSTAERAALVKTLTKVLANVETANAIRPQPEWFEE